MRHQEPPAAPLLYRMVMSTNRRLGDLIEEGVGVMHHNRAHSAANIQFFAQNIRSQPQRRAGHLNIGAARCMMIAENHREAHRRVEAGNMIGKIAISY